MNRYIFAIAIALCVADTAAAPPDEGRTVLPQDPAHGVLYERREVEGWSVYVRRELLEAEAMRTGRAIELLRKQLDEVVRAVPAAAVKELRQVPLYFSPEYPGRNPTAEFHPDAGWLRANGRDPAMGKGVEFTNIRIFEAETRRMPNFALHELAHAYHDRVLAGGFANPRIKLAYDHARASGKYDCVERQDSEGRKHMDRAYALSNSQEYFAETTEAFFATNDFFPFTRDQLRQHDPEMFKLLGDLWGAEEKQAPPANEPAAALEQAPAGFDHRPRSHATNDSHLWGISGSAPAPVSAPPTPPAHENCQHF